MANMADCAVAIAKADLGRLDGAIRRREGNDGLVCFTTKRTYECDATGDEYAVYEKQTQSIRKIGVKKNGVLVKEYTGNECNNCEIYNKLDEQGYHLTSNKVIRDVYSSNDWVVDFAKLDAYSYEFDPFIIEKDDYVVVHFGGRWGFPETLEQKLGSAGVCWQGAGCEDGMDWQNDEIGNYDFGLRILADTENCDGETYTYHYVMETDERRN